MVEGIATFRKAIKLPEEPSEKTEIIGLVEGVSFTIKDTKIKMSSKGEYVETILIVNTIRGLSGKDGPATIKFIMKKFSGWEGDIPSSWLTHLDSKNLPANISTHK